MRFAVVMVFGLGMLAACRPEPVPHNPGRGPRGPVEEHVVDRDPTQSKAPDESVVVRADGTQFDLATLWQKHRALVVFYMGGWCPHCKRQLETLQQYQKEISELDAVIVGVSADKPEDAKAFHDKLGLAYELVSDPDLTVIAKWGVEDVGQHLAYPATFIVEPGGAISFRKVGTGQTDRPTIEQIMTALRNTQ